VHDRSGTGFGLERVDSPAVPTTGVGWSSDEVGAAGPEEDTGGTEDAGGAGSAAEVVTGSPAGFGPGT